MGVSVTEGGDDKGRSGRARRFSDRSRLVAWLRVFVLSAAGCVLVGFLLVVESTLMDSWRVFLSYCLLVVVVLFVSCVIAVGVVALRLAWLRFLGGRR